MSTIKNFMERLCENGADAALISSELNQRYLSGFNYTDGYVLVTKSRAFLLTDFRYIEAAKTIVSAEEFEIVMPSKRMYAALADIMAENGVKTLILEENSVSMAERDSFEKAFEGIELLGGASKIIEDMRLFKTSEELAFTAVAQSFTDAAFAHILEVIHPEMTEIDVALELEFFMRKQGAEGIAFETIAVSGSASSMPHGVPRNQKLERGFLTMDFGAKYNGYCADMTRTIVLGKADDDMKKLYNTVLSAQKAALDMLGEGVCCCDADKCARDIIDNAGYEGCFGHSLGHGVGMLVHERPSLSFAAPKDSVLRRGHIVTVEPGIYIEGKYGCRIEDMVAIDLDGKLHNFTKSPKEMIEIF